MVHIKTLLGALFGVGVLIFIYFNNPSDPKVLPCPVYTYLGVYCAGCGSTRALHSLLHGNVLAAFRYNPLMVASIPLLSYMSLAQMLKQIMGRKLPRVFRTSRDVNIVLAIILSYTVLRNIPIFPFKLLAPL